MRSRDWLTVSIFGVTLVLWVFFSGRIGLGAPALIGVCLYLITGLVEWEDLQSGVNWGVFLIYAATISLGTAIERTGAASWVASHFLAVASSVGLGAGPGLLAAVAILTVAISSFISRAPALGILSPIVLVMAQDIRNVRAGHGIRHGHLLGLHLHDDYRVTCQHDHLQQRIPPDEGLPQGRRLDDSRVAAASLGHF